MNSSPTDDQGRADQEQTVGPRVPADRVGDARQPHRAGVAVEQRHAVQEERRGERAEQEVLQRRLLREEPPATREAAQQVERQREHLERDEHRQQVVGRREHQHAADREHQQREDLGLGDAGGRQRALVLGARQGRAGRGERAAGVQCLLGRRQQAGQREQQDRALQELRRAVDGDGALRDDRDVAGGQHERDERPDQPRRGQTELHLVAPQARHEGLDQHADHRDTEDDQHRSEQPVVDARGVEGGRKLHRRGAHGAHGSWPSATGTTGSDVASRRPAPWSARSTG